MGKTPGLSAVRGVGAARGRLTEVCLEGRGEGSRPELGARLQLGVQRMLMGRNPDSATSSSPGWETLAAQAAWSPVG